MKRTKQPNVIAAIRKRRNLTQQQLGELIGAHYVTVSKLENGLLPITQAWLTKIADALRVDELDIIEKPLSKKKIYITGFVTGNARLDILNMEDVDEKYHIEMDLNFDETGFSQWIIVDGDALYPVIKHLDMLRITLSDEKFTTQEIQGNLCAIQTNIKREGPLVVIGIPTTHYGGDLYDIHMLNGPAMRKVEIKAVARVTMALFNPPVDPESMHYAHYLNDPPQYRSLADWLNKA